MRFGASAAAILLVLGLAARIPVFAQAGPTLEPVHPFEVASIRQGTSRDRVLSLVSLGYAMPLYRIEGLQFQAKLIFERRGDGWKLRSALVIDRLETPSEN